MKQKILLCLLLAGSFSLTTKAQIQKGKWIAGLSLNGYQRTTNGYQPTIRDYTGITKTFNTQITVGKMISKHWLLGIGVFYGHLLDRSIDPLAGPAYNNKTIVQDIGPLVQTGYYKEVAKNVYLSILADFSYLDYKITLRQDYGSTNESKFIQKGYKIKSTFTPLQCSYLYKNKFLASLTLANISYNFRTFDNGPNSNGGYLKESELTYSLNPFQNGITFSYIFK